MRPRADSANIEGPMKPLKLLLALPVVGAGIGVAAPALADSNDDTFLATLQAAGITSQHTPSVGDQPV